MALDLLYTSLQGSRVRTCLSERAPRQQLRRLGHSFFEKKGSNVELQAMQQVQNFTLPISTMNIWTLFLEKKDTKEPAAIFSCCE